MAAKKTTTKRSTTKKKAAKRKTSRRAPKIDTYCVGSKVKAAVKAKGCNFGGDSLDEFVRNAEAFAATLP